METGAILAEKSPADKVEMPLPGMPLSGQGLRISIGTSGQMLNLSQKLIWQLVSVSPTVGGTKEINWISEVNSDPWDNGLWDEIWQKLSMLDLECTKYNCSGVGRPTVLAMVPVNTPLSISYQALASLSCSNIHIKFISRPQFWLQPWNSSRLSILSYSVSIYRQPSLLDRHWITTMALEHPRNLFTFRGPRHVNLKFGFQIRSQVRCSFRASKLYSDFAWRLGLGSIEVSRLELKMVKNRPVLQLTWIPRKKNWCDVGSFWDRLSGTVWCCVMLSQSRLQGVSCSQWYLSTGPVCP